MNQVFARQTSFNLVRGMKLKFYIESLIPIRFNNDENKDMSITVNKQMIEWEEGLM